MSSQIDLIFDRLIAQEKLKDGTKYERLAAIAFSLLTGRETVHDLRLLGASGVRHQIDAVIGQPRKRVLVETKDYDRKIGLPIIRNFWGAVEDIRPDESFVVTTVGFTAPAITYANAKGIRSLYFAHPRRKTGTASIARSCLTSLRPGRPASQTSPGSCTPTITTRSTVTAQERTPSRRGSSSSRTRTATSANSSRSSRRNSLRTTLGGDATIGRVNIFDEPTWLVSPGRPPLRVEAWKWEVNVASDTTQVVVGDGVGGLVAELALRTIDGSIRRMFTNRQLEAWTFDGHAVVPRNG